MSKRKTVTIANPLAWMEAHMPPLTGQTCLAAPPNGTRIRLISTDSSDDNPIPAGTTGTVTGSRGSDGEAQVEVAWDNGRKLWLLIPDDKFEIIKR